MLNKVILMGRLTADPELKHTPSGVPVCSFAIAVTRSFNKDETDFFDIVAWRNTAEFIAKYFTKGQQIALSGRLQARTWDDKQGNKRKSVEVVVDEAFFADSKKGGTGAAQREEALPFDFADSNISRFTAIEDDEDGSLPF